MGLKPVGRFATALYLQDFNYAFRLMDTVNYSRFAYSYAVKPMSSDEFPHVIGVEGEGIVLQCSYRRIYLEPHGKTERS